MTHDFQADIDAVNGIVAVPTILDVICATTGMGFAAVARVTEGRWIACRVRDDVRFGLAPGDELKIESTICHEIRQHRQPVIIDHVAEDPEYRDHHTPATYGLQSYISMPIILRDGTFFGTLCAIDAKPHMLKTPAVIGMFILFADLIAFHLKANERIAHTESRLADAEETSTLREQFIAVLGHDLRNPLASISSGASLLLREPQTGKSTRILGLMQGSVRRMAGLIDNVMDFARGRLGGGLSLSTGAADTLPDHLRQVVSELQASWADRIIVADLDIATPVHCDPARLAQLLSNLLANALTHGAPGQPIRIQARTEGGAFRLSVANGGAPIPKAAMQQLFQPFFRGAVRPSQQGLGLGLFIVSEIARAHGGAIDVASTAQETCFTFEMPLQPAS